MPAHPEKENNPRESPTTHTSNRSKIHACSSIMCRINNDRMRSNHLLDKHVRLPLSLRPLLLPPSLLPRQETPLCPRAGQALVLYSTLHSTASFFVAEPSRSEDAGGGSKNPPRWPILRRARLHSQPPSPSPPHSGLRPRAVMLLCSRRHRPRMGRGSRFSWARPGCPSLGQGNWRRGAGRAFGDFGLGLLGVLDFHRRRWNFPDPHLIRASVPGSSQAAWSS